MKIKNFYSKRWKSKRTDNSFWENISYTEDRGLIFIKTKSFYKLIRSAPRKKMGKNKKKRGKFTEEQFPVVNVTSKQNEKTLKLREMQTELPRRYRSMSIYCNVLYY